MLPFRAVVFDLDGTLVDSLADIAAAVNCTLESRGRKPFRLDDYRLMVGKGLRKLLELATADQPLGAREFEEMYRDLVANYRNGLVVRTSPYDGIVDMLEACRGLYRLAVLSNKDDEMTKEIVSRLFPSGSFDLVQGLRAGVPAKPDSRALVPILESLDVNPAECFFVGDSNVDMQTARATGTVGLGVLWGFRTADELWKAGATEVFGNPAELKAFLTRSRLDKGPYADKN